ncbi:protein AMBP [Hippocampus zosterae]|uniref:protein AMBP n=1 Tax=Hippocampus zosterae TaxID=109293 RepID=UPI00223D42D4|nr:protein AMBP [Hippocampus zosterae]
MRKIAFLASVLILACIWTIQALVLPEPTYPTQENFDLTRFLGTWHDVAVAKTCPHIDHHRMDSAIGKLVLQRGPADDKLEMIRTVLKNGTCKQKSGHYHLTTTPGHFHFTKWGTEVDAYVVHTNYEEYALMISVKERSPGQRSISVKLYSRTMDVRDTLLDDFKRLVREQGMSDDNIIIKQNKGHCEPEEQVEEPATVFEVSKRTRRDVAPTLALAEMELDGSGDNMLTFNGSEACSLGPEPGPCFGIKQHYFYNSSAMSCQKFIYGGCLGNKNNFKTERECLQRCRTEAVCRLPLSPVACTGEPLNWSFDSTLGECVPYKAGYCQTNGNRFYSKAECEEYCGLKVPKILEEE